MTDLTHLVCARCSNHAEGGLIDLWENTEEYLCRVHMQAEFDAIRSAPLDTLERKVLELGVEAVLSEGRLLDAIDRGSLPQTMDHVAIASAWRSAVQELIDLRATARSAPT